MTKTPITPETKVGALLEAYPEAEAALIEIAPQFKALKNPVLRRTVANVATLEQAARVAGLTTSDLVRSLRHALGVVGGEGEGGPDSASEDAEVPGWVQLDAETAIDAGTLLDAGETPIGVVSKALAEMAIGDVLVVGAPFQPAPLIDALRRRGHEVVALSDEGGSWKVWVRRAGSPNS
jgi:TusA-related sulfurtransferase